MNCGTALGVAKRQAEREQLLQTIADGGIDLLPTIEDVPLVLKGKDRCIMALDNVQLYESRMVREYVGGSRGVSVRIMKGVNYRVGGFSGHSESHPELRQIDVGKLYITTKRFAYSGSISNTRIDIPISNIESLTVYSDAIEIGRKGKQRKEFYTGIDGPYAQAVLAGAINSFSKS